VSMVVSSCVSGVAIQGRRFIPPRAGRRQALDRDTGAAQYRGCERAPRSRRRGIMKITSVTARVLCTPADNPLVVGLPAPTDTREFVTLELGTDQGLVGIGLTFFGGALTPALKSAVQTLGELIVGDDPTQTEAITAKCRKAASSCGPGGIFSLALSPIDMACWDLKG